MQLPARVFRYALTALMAASFANAEPFQLGPIPKEGVLILRNGQAVAGRLTRAGNHFFVALPEGEIRLRADDVEMACHDVDEAYLRKRATMPSGDVHRHIELAGWCMRQGLLGPAAAELADAIRAEPSHPMIPVLRRRLEMAMHPTEEHAEEPAETIGPSREELDALVRRLPSGTVEAFTSEVQPLLMNHCTNSGCHGPSSDHPFSLLRVPRNRPGGRRITQQNLHAVLQWVDGDTPEASKLLTVPIEPHGGMDRPIFTQRELGQLRQLADWVGRLRTPGEREEVPESLTRIVQPGLPPQNAAHSAAENDAFSAPRRTRTSEPAAKGSQVQRGAPLKGFVPADPFDPAIFNRRHSGDE